MTWHVRINLECDDSFVSCPKHIVLMPGARMFSVLVDPGSLTRGEIFYSEIRGRNSEDGEVRCSTVVSHKEGVGRGGAGRGGGELTDDIRDAAAAGLLSAAGDGRAAGHPRPRHDGALSKGYTYTNSISSVFERSGMKMAEKVYRKC